MNQRVLVAEDDPAISRMMRTNLSAAGYRVTCVPDGQEAVGVIGAEDFDLALLDIMLPEIDGLALMPYMQEKRIPVI